MLGLPIIAGLPIIVAMFFTVAGAVASPTADRYSTLAKTNVNRTIDMQRWANDGGAIAGDVEVAGTAAIVL